MNFKLIINFSILIKLFFYFTNEGDGLLFQRFIIMSFNIIKQVLLCPEFKMPKQIDDEGKIIAQCGKMANLLAIEKKIS